MSGVTDPRGGSEAACRTGLPSAADINVYRPFKPSEYLEPGNVEEASRLLAQYGERARIIAGGTDLLLERDPGIEVLIGIRGLKLDTIRVDPRGGTIGAAACFAEIASTPALLEQPYRALAQAALEMGTPQIRNQATVGGNLCSAVSCADSPPPLLVLDATLDVVGPAGERSVAIADFFEDVRANSLRPGEILAGIRLPELPPRTATVFIKKGRVGTGDLAVVNLAVRLTLGADDSCSEVRIALGAVAPTPLRTRGAETILEGRRPEEPLLEQAAARAVEEISPIDDIRASADYRRTLTRSLLQRALRDAVAELTATDRKSGA
jgi:carbon-monoxide dehydrogenase medium subunit